MSYKIHTIFILTIISCIAIRGSEHTKLYNKHDIQTTIANGITSAQESYENKQYQEAALFARGACEYATINKMTLHIEDNIIIIIIVSKVIITINIEIEIEFSFFEFLVK